jgi:GT2 family glycosyltransferase
VNPPGPEVSVVVVAFRARDYVLACLEALAANAGVAYEAIVVDDGSGDGTPAAVRERFPDAVMVAKEQNEGPSAGRNSALPHVRGRFVLMLDSDTKVHEGAIGRLVTFLDERPEVGLVGPRLVNPDGTVQHSCRRWPSPLIPFMRRGPYARLVPEPRAHRDHMMMDFDFATERPVVAVMGAAQMWRSDLTGLIGRYDERISSYGGEDVDWCLRVWRAGLEVRYVPDAVIEHEWQHVVRRQGLSRHSLLALRDFYYLQAKHRRLRRDPRLAAALA